MYQVSRKRRKLECLSLLWPWVLDFSQAVFGPYQSLIYSNTYNKMQAIPYNYTYCFPIKLKRGIFIHLLFVRRKEKKGKVVLIFRRPSFEAPSPKCCVCLPLALRIGVFISSSVKWEWKYTPQKAVDRIIHCIYEALGKLWALPSLPLSYFPLGIRQLFTGAAETTGMGCSPSEAQESLQCATPGNISENWTRASTYFLQ